MTRVVAGTPNTKDNAQHPKDVGVIVKGEGSVIVKGEGREPASSL